MHWLTAAGPLVTQVCTTLRNRSVCPALSDLHRLLPTRVLPTWIITRPTSRTASSALSTARSRSSTHPCTRRTTMAGACTPLPRERSSSERVSYPLRFHLRQSRPTCRNPENDTSRWRATIQWPLIQLRSDLRTSEYAGFFLIT